MALKTPFYNIHNKLGANIIEFGGWDMPVYYTTPIEEHNVVRNSVGLFDTSHMGEIIIKGNESFDFLQQIVSRDLAKLSIGQVYLCVMCNYEGGIIDDLTISKLNDNEFFLVVNAGTKQKDFEWMKSLCEKAEADCEVVDISSEIAKLDLQGPKSNETLQKLTSYDLTQIKRYHFAEFDVAGIQTIVSRSGYSGEDGFELYFDPSEAEKMWNFLMDSGKDFGIEPCGLGARDTLRLECAMMLYGNDIDEQHTPIQGSYNWVVSFNKDFVGKDAMLKQQEKGIVEKIIGFEMLDRGIARHGYEIFKAGTKIGTVTSGAPGPTINKNIGLAYVKSEFAEIGNEIEIKIRENLLKAKIVPIPFYKRQK